MVPTTTSTAAATNSSPTMMSGLERIMSVAVPPKLGLTVVQTKRAARACNRGDSAMSVSNSPRTLRAQPDSRSLHGTTE
jgi:hypothetical protein